MSRAGAARALVALLGASVALAAGCGSSSGGGDSGATCAAVCARFDQATCSDAGVSDCVEGCNEALAGPCQSRIHALLECAASASVACSGGRAQAAGCDAEDQALRACEASLVVDAGAD